MKRKRKHAPSAYRDILRRAKKVEGEDDREILALIREAKVLEDPYYSSLALLSLSSDPRLKLSEAVSAAKEGIGKINEVTRKWRRGELITAEAKELKLWRGGATRPETEKERDSLYENILEIVGTMPSGKGRSDAIKGAARHFPGRYMERFFKLASVNTEFTVRDLKSIIRSWVLHDDREESPFSPESLISQLGELKDNGVASRSFGYLHLQIKKSDPERSDDHLFEEAVRLAVSVDDDESKLDSMRYLITVADDEAELIRLASAVDKFNTPDHAARFYTTLGGRADRISSERAGEWFIEGIRTASRIEDDRERAAVRLNLAEGLTRSGMTEKAKEVFSLALADCDLIGRDGMNIPGRQKIERVVEGLGMELPKEFHRHGSKSESEVGPQVDGIPKNEGAPSSEFTVKVGRSEDSGESGDGGGKEELSGAFKHGRHVLALYNTYEGGLKPVHLRAISRAAPLCYAYELDLAMLNFPTDDLPGLVDEVIAETNIGKGGKYLRELVGKGRLLLDSPGDYDAMGRLNERYLVLATTSHPRKEKLVTFEDALGKANEEHRHLCLVMGLGKKGLSPSFLNAARYHLELTGRNVSLETCTVMGIIAEKLRI